MCLGANKTSHSDALQHEVEILQNENKHLRTVSYKKGQCFICIVLYLLCAKKKQGNLVQEIANLKEIILNQISLKKTKPEEKIEFDVHQDQISKVFL